MSSYANTTSLDFSPEDLMLKIQNYVPPVKEELDKQVITIDSYYKSLGVPPFFYDYFNDTFIIKAYTCDVMPTETYEGIKDVYSCYCNNQDYHSLPQINFELQS